MAHFELDLDRIRQNWVLGETSLGENLAAFSTEALGPSRLQEAGLALDRVRELVQRELTPRHTTLAPFFDEAAKLLRTLKAPGHPSGEPDADAPSRNATQARLLAVLADIEDLLALYSGVEY
jgi:hypothetical protein